MYGSFNGGAQVAECSAHRIEVRSDLCAFKRERETLGMKRKRLVWYLLAERGSEQIMKYTTSDKIFRNGKSETGKIDIDWFKASG